MRNWKNDHLRLQARIARCFFVVNAISLRQVALLRGINVGGHNKIPMAELRAHCSRLGLSDVQTYVQSGNVVFRSADSAQEIEGMVERAIKKHFGISVPVIVRTGKAWQEYVDSNPFGEASNSSANLVHLLVSKAPPARSATSQIRERAKAGERVVSAGGAIWIHYPNGSARSKLTPTLLDRLIGSPTTARNWRTVSKLHLLLHQ